MPTLGRRQISLGIKTVPLWSKRAQTIRRTFVFDGFLGSMDFVNRVARMAEKLDHHPDINIRWNKVTLALTTHSQGGLTKKDFALARQCDGAFARNF
jgi:4a-hydroxytetrahydrobiopterin dehydratase